MTTKLLLDNKVDDRAVIRSFEGIRNKRTMAFVTAALLVFVAVMAVVVLGFRGRQISKNAASMANPPEVTTEVVSPPAPQPNPGN